MSLIEHQSWKPGRIGKLIWGLPEMFNIQMLIIFIGE
jgi:hypothetical protein